MARRASWLGAWNAFSKAATKSTVRTQKKVSKAFSKTITKAVGQATARQTTQMTKAARQVLTGVLTDFVLPAPAPSNRGSGHWEEGHWGLGPLLQRKYRMFTPADVTPARPAALLVLLHGCGQDAASFAASTRAAAIARTAGCMVLLPEQSAQANAQRCWNWFRAEAHVAAEAMLLMAIVERVCSQHGVQRDKVYLLGMSAGGSMALTMALRFPERFAAVVSHSGAVPHSAANALQATQSMHGKRLPDTQGLLHSLGGRRLPPLLLVHGDADRTVVADNALVSAALWLELLPRDVSANTHLLLTPGHRREVQRGARRRYSVTDWKLFGQPYVRLIRVAGLGHAWSGGAARQAFSDPAGPDALKLALRFFHDCAARAALAGRQSAG
ncbi:MAG: Poly(3-hydroxyalkanoate) depolymerase [Rhodocyclales bacterium]|nr:Poly(3-hydroxyalkanoate) depolymerase [Rhodocyclales bacterium]